jgi:hypothetical protein
LIDDSLMSAAVAGLIGAFGGALVGLGGAWWLDRAQRIRSDARERRRAYAAFLGALYPAVAELREMPPNRNGGLYERLDSLLTTEQAAWVKTRRGLAATSPQLFSRVDRLLAAIALLQVLDLPDEVTSAVDDAVEYVERLGEDRTPGRVAEWPPLHERLQRAVALL